MLLNRASSFQWYMEHGQMQTFSYHNTKKQFCHLFFTLPLLIHTVLFCSQNNKPDKNTSEDDVTNAKTSTPTPDANTKPQTTTLTPSDSSQGSEGAEPAPSSSPSVSQHQTVYQLPLLSAMYTQLPNMTNLPRLPQGISVESDGSDLPEGTSPPFPLC